MFLDYYEMRKPEPVLMELANALDARVLTNRAVMRAAAHADAAVRGWSGLALGYVIEYSRLHHKFTSEDVRLYAEPRGLAKPPDCRSWGGVMQHAQRLGYIRRVGFATSRCPHAHMRPVRQWEVVL